MNTLYQEYKGFLWKDFKWEENGEEFWKIADRWPVELGWVMLFKKSDLTLDESIEKFRNHPDLLYGNEDRFKFNV